MNKNENFEENLDEQKRNSRKEKQKLFSFLKSTTEKILGQRSYDVWAVHGGVESLTNAIDKILQFGNKKQVGHLGPIKDYWLFVRGLKWLQPSLGPDIDYLSKLPASSPTKIKLESFKSRRYQRQTTLPTHGQQWIENSLKNGTLKSQLEILTSDLNYVEDHYHDWSFIKDPLYLNAMKICVEALEQNSSAILANISLQLLVGPDNEDNKDSTNVRIHRGITNPDVLPILNENSEKPETEIIEKSDPLSVALSGFLETKNIPLSRKSSVLSNDKILTSSDSISRSFSSHSFNENSSFNRNVKQRLFDNCNVNYSLNDGLEMSRKPLFDDDEEFLGNADALGFLAEQGSSLFSQIGYNSNFKEISKTTKNEEINNLQYPDSNNENNSLNKNLINYSLPDIITSAEDSLSNPRQLSTSLQDNKQQQNIKTSKKNDSLKESPTLLQHRRCRSHHFTQLDGFGSNSEISENSSTQLFIKPSTSMPTLNQDQMGKFGNKSDPSLPKSQSLMNYLKNQDLITCAELDKENAHFHFSELLIGAIEQMKCSMKKSDSHSILENPSDAFIIQDGMEPTTSHKSLSQPSIPPVNYNSPCSSVSSILTISPTDKEIVNLNEATGLHNEPETSSKETHKDSVNKTLHGFGKNFGRFDSLRTAESIAIGLLQTFKDKQPIKLSDLQYLISEEDVPQQLLPLPASIAIDPDAVTYSNNPEPGIRLRGNQEWAPPRPQIIFHPPKKVKLKVAMLNQNYRCAGCGTQVNKAYIKRFRYCEYIGKYFCTCCHDNNMSVIPAYILQKFDFTKYKVSNFCFDFLNRIRTEPLFHIEDINPAIYKKVKILSQIRDLRIQLSLLYKYIQICRYANSDYLENEIEENEMETQPLTYSLHLQVTKTFMPHFYGDDIHIYSIDDLQNNKDILLNLKIIVEKLSNHVTNCELCRMKGFVCEVCNKEDDIIFPHQSKTISCPLCKACYHKKCYNADNCLKCQRIKKRRAMLKEKE